MFDICVLPKRVWWCTQAPTGERGSSFLDYKDANKLLNKQTKPQISPAATNTLDAKTRNKLLLPLSLSFPLSLSLSSVVEDGGLSIGDGMVRDGRRCFGGVGGGGS